jgi:hypothetical protein
VLYYADEEDANYHMFHLPKGVLKDPEGEEVTLAQLSQLKKTKRQKNQQEMKRMCDLWMMSDSLC